MKLNFLLHDFSRYAPFGGIKQQYELANQFAARGHDVAVYHSLNFNRGVLKHPRSLVGLVRYNARGSQAIEWLALQRGVRCRYLPRMDSRLLRSTDVTIMSSARVAEAIPQRAARIGRLLYLVYEYPVWKYGRADLKERLSKALTRDDAEYISSSFATDEMLESLGVRPIGKVTCAIDLPQLDQIPATEDRRPVIGFALRPERYKGAADMLQAMSLLREQHPNARYECFGRYDGDDLSFPDDLHAHGYLDQDELLAFYRRCMIFVSPSYAEGWGLTAAEAMANGAAVVVTDDGGSRDFATHGETALVVPPREPDKLAAAVSTLLRDSPLRNHIVAGGVKRSRRMSWEHSIEALEALLRGESRTA